MDMLGTESMFSGSSKISIGDMLLLMKESLVTSQMALLSLEDAVT